MDRPDRTRPRVDARLQTVRAGYRIWLTPENYLGRLPGQYWRVRRVEPAHSLVLEQRPPENPAAEPWELGIEDAGNCGVTRRSRGPVRWRTTRSRSTHGQSVCHERWMLSGIKDRAEKRA